MKKFLSTILAVVMVLSSMAMVVSANDVDYAEGYYYVNGVQYTDFMAAVSAANGGTVIVSGECAFSSRLAVNSSVTLQGVNDATIVPSASYGSTNSTTNWKGLLNIAGENVVVNDITFDGSLYGDNQAITVDFKPVRVTSGTTTFNNVTITGSKRTLLMIGTSSSSATVNANNLTIEADAKTVTSAHTYADVEVTNASTLNYNSGVVNGYVLCENGTTKTISVAGLYGFVYSDDMIYTTPEHLAENYLNGNVSALAVKNYASVLTSDANKATATGMVNDIVTANDTALAATFVTMIDDMVSKTIPFLGSMLTSDEKAVLNGYKATLSTILVTE
ncbi:MAG: hypothetical protein IJA34_05380 [Lachnospiraceae bacterium]|nr:hypothetical protein [Lachnospiraceae bacterium]